MSRVAKGAAILPPFPYRREMDSRETQLIGRYAQDIGLILYAWNGMMSAMFMLYLGAGKSGVDVQAGWSKLRADAARLDAVEAAVKGKVGVDAVLGDDITWTVERVKRLLPFRNAIVHLGLNYIAGEVGPDPYGKKAQAEIVQRFLDMPGDLSTVAGDLRVISQYVADLSMRLMYSWDDPEKHMARPELFFEPHRLPKSDAG